MHTPMAVIARIIRATNLLLVYRSLVWGAVLRTDKNLICTALDRQLMCCY